MTTHYQKHDIDSIMKYFVEGFELKKGKSIFNYDWFYDSRKGVVIFRLTMEDVALAPARRQAK